LLLLLLLLSIFVLLKLALQAGERQFKQFVMPFRFHHLLLKELLVLLEDVLLLLKNFDPLRLLEVFLLLLQIRIEGLLQLLLEAEDDLVLQCRVVVPIVQFLN
jgi:hypothetical protein